VKDATWIADLLAHGLIRGSLVPPTPIQDLRALIRTRKQLVREVGRNTQRIQKALEDANIKLTTVVTDILGKSGRAVLDALVAGESDPEKLVALTQRLKAPREKILEALRGRMRDHPRFLIQLHLAQVDALNQAIRGLEARVEEHLGPFRKNVEVLTTMPGISETAASVIVSEIGPDMARFPTAGHLVSWAGLCPRSDESAGKRRSTRIRHGAPWLKTLWVQCAWAAIRAKDSYLRAQFHRLKARRGPMKAIIAVARLDVDCRFPHALDRQRIQRLGRCPLRQARSRQTRQAPRPPPRRPGPQGHRLPGRVGSGFLLVPHP